MCGNKYITASTSLPMLTHKFIYLKRPWVCCDVKFKEAFVVDLISRMGNADNKLLP